MPALKIPTSSTPGLLTGEGEGRLVNVYAEKSGESLYWRRVPGLTTYVDTNLSGPRGMIDVAGTLYAAYADQIARRDPDGARFNFLASIGTGAVTWARNNKTTNGAADPDLVLVRSTGNAILVYPDHVAPYPDADLPATVTSVSFLGGYFLFTVPDGRIIASGTTATPTNTTDIDPLSFATAESSTDALIRGIVFGGTFFAMGAESIEPWLNQGLAPFPLQRATSVIPIGLLSFSAVAGHEDGWGYNPFFVASDRTVRELTGYTTRVVSTPAVEAFINASDATTLEACVFTFRGRAHWCLTSNVGTWVYDVTAQSWHERRSDGRANWRGSRSVKSNGRWLVGDRVSSWIMAVDAGTFTEGGAPLPATIESDGLKEFPLRSAIKAVFADFTLGRGDGTTPNPQVAISWSHDGGYSWAGPVYRPLGPAGRPVGPVRVNRLGLASHHGIQVRFVVSDPVDFSFMGATLPQPEPRAP